MKKLYILRHAKSAYPEDTDDHERPLNKRGEESCKLIGQYMEENSIVPDLILSSDSVRTTQTIRNILQEIGSDIKPKFLKSLYLATPGEILQEIVKVNDSAESLMIVCHNPGAAYISALLINDGDSESINNMKTKFPTAALASISLDLDSWKNVNPGGGYLEGFIVPKMLG